MSRPVVVVIEVSAYPASKWVDEAEDYEDYPERMRTLAARMGELGNASAAAELAGLADAFERRRADD
jgi:hypothetical protein